MVLKNTKVDYDSSKANLMTIAGNDSNSWGTAGNNGANITFTGIKQTLKGNIEVDSISSMDYYLLKGSTYTGATSITINSVNTSASASPP